MNKQAAITTAVSVVSIGVCYWVFKKMDAILERSIRINSSKPKKGGKHG